MQSLKADKSDQKRTQKGKAVSRRNRALIALAESDTVKAAAKQSGVARTTLYEWMNEPEFRGDLTKLRYEIFADGILQIRQAMSTATKVIVELMESPDDRIRLAACRTILSTGLKAHELMETEERLRKMEVSIERHEKENRR
jgi:hypothetical protein